MAQSWRSSGRSGPPAARVAPSGVGLGVGGEALAVLELDGLANHPHLVALEVDVVATEAEELPGRRACRIAFYAPGAVGDSKAKRLRSTGSSGGTGGFA